MSKLNKTQTHCLYEFSTEMMLLRGNFLFRSQVLQGSRDPTPLFSSLSLCSSASLSLSKLLLLETHAKGGEWGGIRQLSCSNCGKHAENCGKQQRCDLA